MDLCLYYIFETAAVRSILLTATQIGIDLSMTPTPSLIGGLTPESIKAKFLRVNAHTTPPTFNDKCMGISLWEPNAISIYLVMKYGSDSDLYPSSPQARAKVDQILYFSLKIQKLLEKMWIMRVFYDAKPTKQMSQRLEDLLSATNEYLAGNKWLAGDTLTLADVVMAAIVTDLVVVEKHKILNLKNVCQWYNHCKEEILGFNKNVTGALDFSNYFSKLIKSIA